MLCLCCLHPHPGSSCLSCVSYGMGLNTTQNPHCSSVCSICQTEVWDLDGHVWQKGHHSVLHKNEHDCASIHLINTSAVGSCKWLSRPDLNNGCLVLKMVQYSVFLCGKGTVFLADLAFTFYISSEVAHLYYDVCLWSLIRNVINVTKSCSVFAQKSFSVFEFKISFLHQSRFFCPLMLIQMFAM